MSKTAQRKPEHSPSSTNTTSNKTQRKHKKPRFTRTTSKRNLDRINDNLAVLTPTGKKRRLELQQQNPPSCMRTSNSGKQQQNPPSCRRTSNSGKQQQNPPSCRRTSNSRKQQQNPSSCRRTSNSRKQQQNPPSCRRTSNSGKQQQNPSSCRRTSNSGKQQQNPPSCRRTSNSRKQQQNPSSCRRTSNSGKQQQNPSSCRRTSNSRKQQQNPPSCRRTSNSGKQQQNPPSCRRTSNSGKQQQNPSSCRRTSNSGKQQQNPPSCRRTSNSGKQQQNPPSSRRTSNSRKQQQNPPSCRRTSNRNQQSKLNGPTCSRHFQASKSKHKTSTQEFAMSKQSASKVFESNNNAECFPKSTRSRKRYITIEDTESPKSPAKKQIKVNYDTKTLLPASETKRRRHNNPPATRQVTRRQVRSNENNSSHSKQVRLEHDKPIHHHTHNDGEEGKPQDKQVETRSMTMRLRYNKRGRQHEQLHHVPRQTAETTLSSTRKDEIAQAEASVKTTRTTRTQQQDSNCNHDNQETLTYLPECELVIGPESKRGKQLRYDRCRKYPGHEGFIPVREFSVEEHLPPGYQCEKVKRWIQTLVNRTVMVLVNNTSPNRPDTCPNCRTPYPDSEYKGKGPVVRRKGTGFILEDPILVRGAHCPCDSCSQSEVAAAGNRRDFVVISVDTAAHVAFDDFEAKCAQIELFYDSDDGEGVKVLNGLACSDVFGDETDATARSNRDYTRIICVSHDTSLMEQIPPINKTLEWYDPKILGNEYGDMYHPDKDLTQVSVIVSHPHACSKKITIGTSYYLQKTLPPSHSKDALYKIPAGVKFQRTSTDPTAAESLQRFLKASRAHRPWVEYTLRNDVFVSLPPEPICLCESIQRGVVEFPVGSRFISGREGEPVVLRDVGFMLSDALVDWFDDEGWYLVYDTKTCAGSSGAHIAFDQVLVPLMYEPLHFGEFLRIPGTTSVNRSGKFTVRDFEDELW